MDAVDAVDALNIGGGDIVFSAKRSNPLYPHIEYRELCPLCPSCPALVCPFFTKGNVPTTNIYYIHCVHCIHCILHGLTFCTKGNGPHHPYFLNPLCELIFLHQHLLHPLHPCCIHTASPLCPLHGLTFLH